MSKEIKGVYIVGNRGNMGRRYGAVLRHLGVTVGGHDVGEEALNPFSLRRMFDGVLIATPTACHLDNLLTYLPVGLPILCEKPLSTDVAAVREFDRRHGELCQQLVTMVNQYDTLVEPSLVGDTYYNYWNSGKDGVGWDHINIIGLASGKVTIGTSSPTWHGVINGLALDQAMIDTAYICMVGGWLGGGMASNWKYAIRAHEKTNDWIMACKNSVIKM